MDLSSASFSPINAANQWPNPGALLRYAPFGGGFGNCMLVCAGDSGDSQTPNLCYRLVSVKEKCQLSDPGWILGSAGRKTASVGDATDDFV
jgi:hypothetical protein